MVTKCSQVMTSLSHCGYPENGGKSKPWCIPNPNWVVSYPEPKWTAAENKLEVQQKWESKPLRYNEAPRDPEQASVWSDNALTNN